MLLKTCTAIFLSALSLFFAGCEGPVSVDTHGEAIAAKIGLTSGQLVFVSHGDIARADDLGAGYSAETKGMLAITDSDIYWGLGNVTTLGPEDFAMIPIEQIDSAAMDYDLVHFRVNGELFIFRPHLWNRFEGDVERSVAILDIFWEHDIPIVAPTRSYRSPADVHSSHGMGLHGESSAAAAMGRAQMEAADASWSLNAGNDGVPLVPPSEQSSPR